MSYLLSCLEMNGLSDLAEGPLAQSLPEDVVADVLQFLLLIRYTFVPPLGPAIIRMS